MTLRYSTDIVIFGGGVAGLWLLNRLHNEGYRTILFEQDGLGAGQTLASQGIIHGGLKYALSGGLNRAANIISSMPQRWRECLAGHDSVDLRGCKLLCDEYYMWSQSSIRSKLKTFLGSKSLRGRVESVGKEDYPDFFSQATISGALYKLPDFVIETESLVKTLSQGHEQKLFKLGSGAASFQSDNNGNVNSVVVETNNGPLTIDCQKLIFAAGKGNKQLIESANLQTVKTQLRPLNMVFVKGPNLPSIYVHCIGDSFSLTPKLTVTSHKDSAGQTVWYLGGEIAESGVGKTREEQLMAARQLISKLFPWLDLGDTTWECFAIDRAEPAVDSSLRPDDAYLIEENGIMVAWPTKLTLTPSLGDKVLEQLRDQAILPSAATEIDTSGLTKILTHPDFSAAQWN
jgi:glycerol-3-phosphate dehydrogenase